MVQSHGKGVDHFARPGPSCGSGPGRSAAQPAGGAAGRGPGPMKFIEHRVADRRILRLIRKWLKAGVSEDGQWSETNVGTPQGAVATPLTQKVIWPASLTRSEERRVGKEC